VTGRCAAFAVGVAAALVSPTSGTAFAAPSADTAPAVVDRAVVRFFAPEIGGAEQPRFVAERTLAFEARLEVIAETPDGIGDGYDERHVHTALDHHVSEEMLASLADKLIAGSPPWQRPDKAELERIRLELGGALFERLGGTARVQAAAAAEQLDATEVDALLFRQALAAWYINRAITPILDPSDEQLREAFRTAAHPYRGQTFDMARAALRRWLVIERIRVAEGAFLQGARSRVRTIVIR
jgi:hypothetical protein